MKVEEDGAFISDERCAYSSNSQNKRVSFYEEDKFDNLLLADKHAQVSLS